MESLSDTTPAPSNGDERRASVQDAIKTMRNLGVSLNYYDSSALELLIQWSEDALSAVQPVAQEDKTGFAVLINREACRLHPDNIKARIHFNEGARWAAALATPNHPASAEAGKGSDMRACDLEFAEQALRAIAERRRQMADVIEPINDIRAAASLAKEAHRRISRALASPSESVAVSGEVLDTERLDWIIDHATTHGGGQGFTLTVFIPHDSECVRTSIDAVLALAGSGGKR